MPVDMKILEMPDILPSNMIATDIANLQKFVQSVKDLYHVGKIVITLRDESPASTIGGEWKKIGGGRVLVTAGFENFRYDGDTVVREDSDAATAGQDGGSPRHTHLTPVGYTDASVYFVMANTGGETRVPAYNSAVKYHQAGITLYKDINKFDDDPVRMAYTRENTSYPPYHTCYMWERVR